MKTLEQKFEEVLEDTDSLIREERCAAIADEHAVAFAVWCEHNGARYEFDSMEQALEAFKRTRK